MKRVSLEVSAAVVALLMSCTTFHRDSACGNPVNRQVLVRQVTVAQIRSEYLAQVDAKSLPEQPCRIVEEWIDREIAALLEKKQPTDELWYYKYEKCCGWYRAGYYLVRGWCIAGEINTAVGFN